MGLPRFGGLRQFGPVSGKPQPHLLVELADRSFHLLAAFVRFLAEPLDAYLADPRGDVHGAKMFFKEIPKSRDRADVIAYLTTLK